MMDLTRILSVEHADSQSPGCAWHNDPACLCDVDRSKFVVGDGPYDVPPDMVERFLQRDDDSWLTGAYHQMWWDTMVRRSGMDPYRVLQVFKNHPVEVQDLVDGKVGIKQFREAVCEYGGTVTDVVRLLGIAPRGNVGKGQAMMAARLEAIRLYEDEGWEPAKIRELLIRRGMDLGQTRVTHWLARYSTLYQERKAERDAAKAAA